MEQTDPITRLIELGREERFLEYKASGPWDSYKDKIAKTCMGMANKRDGGTIVIGVAEKQGRFVPEGMLNEHVATYDPDEVQAYINRFADPYVRIELHRVTRNGKKFVAVVVHEFDEIPVVCKRNKGTILRQGAIYCRSHRVHETCEVQSQTEIREIIKMATEKGIRRYLELSERVGVPVEAIIRARTAEAFDRQLEGL